jgi:excisionase family DNA binding protein
MDEILTVEQVADRLQVNIMTVYKWISQGLLEAIRLSSNALRIEAEELEKFLSENGSRINVKSR